MNKYQSFRYKMLIFDLMLSFSLVMFLLVVDDIRFFSDSFTSNYEGVFWKAFLSLGFMFMLSVIGVVRINNFNYIATQKLSENDVHINDYDEFISRAAYLNPNFDNGCSSTVVRDYSVDEMRKVFHLLKMESKYRK